MKKITIIILIGLFVVSYTKADSVVAPSLLTDTIKKEITDIFGTSSPQMTAIFMCESSFQQYRDGKPKLSPTSDVGIAQININNWKDAIKLNLNIFFSELDNLKMAKYILNHQGFTAWTTYKTPCYYRNLPDSS